MDKKKLYWICQTGGWSFLAVMNGFFLKLSGNENVTMSMLILLLLGILFSHVYRNLIVRFGWLRFKVLSLIPRVIFATLLLSLLLYYVKFVFEFMFGITGDFQHDLLEVVTSVLNITPFFFSWSLIYFLFHFIENYKKAEIENLKWEASINEVELNKLKSQLNPHFMFNAMNSIRALVDENPGKSKDAITQLSNILRNTLQMGKNRVIPFDEELKIVNDYLALESIRYEERLKAIVKIHPQSRDFNVPPLMIQTLIENGIKHGISKLVQGGKIEVETNVENEKLTVKICNSGQIVEKPDSESGFGIKNTLQRLQLLYGNGASLSIRNQDGVSVITELVIPKKIDLK
ncbi:MAG: sensor histidine kinase [Bacteroidia bacterium]